MAALQAFTQAYDHVNNYGHETIRLRMEYDHLVDPYLIAKASKRPASNAPLEPEFATYRAPPAITGKFWQSTAKYSTVGPKRQMRIPGAFPDLDKEEPLYVPAAAAFTSGFIKTFIHKFFSSSTPTTPNAPATSKHKQFVPCSEPRPVKSSIYQSSTPHTRSGAGRFAGRRPDHSPTKICGGIEKRDTATKQSVASRLSSSVSGSREDLNGSPSKSPKRKIRRSSSGEPDAFYLDAALQQTYQSKPEATPANTPSMAPNKWSLRRHKTSAAFVGAKAKAADDVTDGDSVDPRAQRVFELRKRIANLTTKSPTTHERSNKAPERHRTKQLVTPPPEQQSSANNATVTDGTEKSTTATKAGIMPRKGILRKRSELDSSESDELETASGRRGLAGAIYRYGPGLTSKETQSPPRITPSPTESTGSLDDFTRDVSRLFVVSDAKRDALDEADRAIQEAQEAAQRAKEEEERKKREEEFSKNAILKPLSQEWSDKVDSTVDELEKNRSYKLPGTHVGLADIQKLLPDRYGGAGWLNDEVVNLYLSKVATQTLEKEGWNKQAPKPVHSFSSQFWTSFSGGGHRAVASWTRRQKIQGANFLSCRAAVIPICNGVHWTALVLSGTDRTIAYYDSMGGNGAPYIARIRDWLAGELGDKYVPDEWRVLETTPQFQANSSDCGVFACLNGHASLVGRVPIGAFRGDDVEASGRRHVAAVLAGMPVAV